MVKKTNDTLLTDIDKKLAVVITDMNYMKQGHQENKLRIANIEKFTMDTHKRLVEGAGKIKRNWLKVCDTERIINEHVEDHKNIKRDLSNTRFRVIDAIFAFLLVAITVIGIFKGG